MKLNSKAKATKECLDAIATLPLTAFVTEAKVWEFHESVGGGWSWSLRYSTTLGWEADRTNDSAERAALALLEHGRYD